MATCRTTDCCNPTDAYHSDQEGFDEAQNCRVVQILTTELDDGEVDSPYSFTFSAFGGVEPYVWTLLSGDLPDGLTLSSGGMLSGTPTEDGDFEFSIKVTDANGEFCQTTLTITIAEAITFTLHSYWSFDESAPGPYVDSYGANDLAADLGTPQNGVGHVGNAVQFGAGGGTVRIKNIVADVVNNPDGHCLMGWYHRSGNISTVICDLTIQDNVNSNLWSPIRLDLTTGGNMTMLQFNYLTSQLSAIITVPAAAINTYGFFRAWYSTATKRLYLQLDNGVINDADASNIYPLPSNDDESAIFMSKGTTGTTRLDEYALFDGIPDDASATYIYNSGAGRTLGPGYPGT